MHEPAKITSPKNERIKEIERLAKRRERERSGLIVIEGIREVERALAGGVSMLEAFHCPDIEAGPDGRRLFAALAAANVPVTEIARSVFAKLAYREESGGLVAVARRPERALDALPGGRAPLYLVVDAVEKPGNLGALLRSADGAGVSGVIVSDPATDAYNPNAIRASLGTIFTVPVSVAAAPEAIRWLKKRGVAIVTTSPEAEAPYTAADLTRAAAVVVGSEDRGLGAAWVEASDVSVRIPMMGAADSLNVSAAATILLHEALRQRESSGIIGTRRKERT
jgi:TrmH family RNA methyltransferase